MFRVAAFCLVLAVVQGHSRGKNQQLDADLQSALMPQELNPAFSPDQDRPWKTHLLFKRSRRDVNENGAVAQRLTTLDQVRQYSRAVAGVTVAVAAIVELVLYFIESYRNKH